MQSGQLGNAQLGWFQLGATPGIQTIVPGALSGPRSIPAPTIPGSPQTLSLAAIGPHRNFANPVVFGPLLPDALTGPRLVAAPIVRLQQRVEPGALAGPRSIPTTATVAFVQLIYPASAIVGPRAIGSPVVEGSPQWLNMRAAVAGPRYIPAPKIDGGFLSTELYLSGVRVPGFSWAKDNGSTIQSQTLGRWRATFGIEAPPGDDFEPSLGQTVLIIDHGRRVFGGCISEWELERPLSTDHGKYRCTAVDKSAVLDRRVVTGNTFLAGDDVVSDIALINANYCNGEGVTLGPELVAGYLGTLPADLPANFQTVAQVYDSIAQQTGTVWWVDAFSVLHFSPFIDLPAAPFGLTETSGNWRRLTVKETTTDYYNKLYAVSNLNVLPGSGSGGQGGQGAGSGLTETFDFHPGSPGISTGVLPDGTLAATGILCSTAIGAVQSLTVNGAAQTVFDIGNYSGQTRTGPTDYLWGFGGPATGVPGVGCAAGYANSIPDHAVVVIVYTPATSTSSSVAQYGTALTPLNPSGNPLGTCGSGWYEGVIQVQNISNQADLDAIALAELNRIGGVPKVLRFETDYPGLAPGQLLSVDIPKSKLANASLLITSVSGVFIPPKLGTDSAYRWTVEARSNLDPGNAWKWFERLIGRTHNPLPVLQYEPATFILGPGGSVSSGVDQTNPYIVGRTGLVTALEISAATPPIDQDLVVSLYADGVFLRSITLPHTATAYQLIAVDIPRSDNLYIFARQVLKVSASYNVTGPNPAKAGKVTFVIRWCM